MNERTSRGGNAAWWVAVAAGTACAALGLPAIAQEPATPPATPPAPPPATPPATEKPADAPAADPAKDAAPAQPPAEGSSRRRRGGAAEEGGAAEAAKEPAPPPEPPIAAEPVVGPTDTQGFAGEGPYPGRMLLQRESIASPDRWRIGWPSWDRYGRQAKSDPVLMNVSGGDSPYTLGSPLNPYDRNILKGDYPIIGQNIFFNFTAVSDTFYQYRKNPTPSGPSTAQPGSFDTFRDGRQQVFNQNLFLTFDIFKGYTSYRPIDWLVRITPAFNINHVDLFENGNLNINPGLGDERRDSFETIQEAFAEVHLGDLTEYFDILSIKVGRQLFVSDFRGFIFNDISDGIKLTGNYDANRIQWNVAGFISPEKDTNSGLNQLNWRDQQIFIANVYLQDFAGLLGYTLQGSFHWNHDNSRDRFDSNGIQVRPDLIGSVISKELDAYYLGFAGDGHIGRWNINHAFYYAFGEEKPNNIAGIDTDIGAFMGAIELSYDMDWFRPKVSFLYASGDEDPLDGDAGGFDAIFDDPNFAGGPTSFYQNQGQRIFGVGLDQGRSFLNTLKSSKAEGQSNFVNPGVFLFNAGYDAEITPTLRTSFNFNALFFSDTSSLEFVLNQNDIGQQIGYEINQFVQWRPFLNNNIIISVGGSLFFPAGGFNDIYNDQQLLGQIFTGVTLTY
ncbi:MAG: hypothetical protein ACKVS8_00240 [Phycisphaerales bacterium]